MRLNHRRSRRPQPTPRSSARDGRRATWRPSLLLWRHRHLVVAVCLGTAVLVALSILRPGPAQGRQVLVAARPIGAGAIIAEQDVTTSRLPTSALPQAGLASQEQVVGTRAAIALEPGTVLTTSMTSGNMTQQLGADERLIQVPVDVGAELARPGARVDVIGQAPEGWTPQADTSQAPQSQEGTVNDSSDNGSKEREEIPSEQGNPEKGQANEPSLAPTTPSPPPPEQQSPGIQKSSQSLSQGISATPFGAHSAVLCAGARVIATQEAGENSRWTGNKKVTLITLAIPAGSVILVVGAATNSTLGIALSP